MGHPVLQLYNNISVVMVAGGSAGVRAPPSQSVELLSSNGSWLCYLPNLPDKRRSSFTLTGSLICGGYQSLKTCINFSGGRWQQTHRLRQGRHGHTAWASPRGVLLMGAAYIGTTTEFVNGTTTPSLENRRNLWNLNKSRR